MRRYRIGRSDTNDIVIPDASVSRQHAEAVELGGGRFALSDLGSTFGTHVWQDQNWIAAKETEIRADTVIRFGEFRTTLMDVLSDTERAALGLTVPSAPAQREPAPQPKPVPRAEPTPAPPQPEPLVAEPPPAPAPPRTTAPAESPPAAATPPTAAPPAPVAPPSPPPEPSVPPPRPQPAERPPLTRDARGLSAARARRPAAGGKRRALVLGLLAMGGFFALAGGVIAAVLMFGDPNGAGPRREPATAAGAGQQKFLEACKTDWGVDERRCRCFLAAAGPHLEPADYDDFESLVAAFVEADSERMESVLQQAGEKRGAPASSRLSAAMKGVGRDCQEQN